MVIDKAKVFDLACLGRRDNDLRGARGNLETFVHFQKNNE
jgi:hypothetical protein